MSLTSIKFIERDHTVIFLIYWISSFLAGLYFTKKFIYNFFILQNISEFFVQRILFQKYKMW